jgi:radical SAM superfamily enzyme YgiQ (UPF0313 family)
VLVRVNDEVLDAELARELDGVLRVLVGIGGGDRRERDRVIAEHVVSDAGHQARIDAAREANQYALHIGEQAP